MGQMFKEMCQKAQNMPLLGQIGNFGQKWHILVFFDTFPEIFEPYKKFAGFGDCKVVALKQYPGQFLPWHEDTYVGFRQEFNVPDDVKVTRYSIFLEDWHWGHYFAAGNNVMHQWKQGDILELKPKMHHTTCNSGLIPKLTMTITGTVTEEFLRKKEDRIFEYQ